MTRSELIKRIAERYPELSYSDAVKLVATFFEEISEALSRGDRIELRGFGAFWTKRRQSRTNLMQVHRLTGFMPCWPRGPRPLL